MKVLTTIAAIIAPSLFWIGYFYYKDRFKPEPLLKLGGSFVLGFASGLICALLLRGLHVFGLTDDPLWLSHANRIQFFIYSLLISGIIEESFKFFPFILYVLKYRSFDEKTDGVIYASMIALGFAGFENLGYLPYMKGFELVGRAIVSPLTHTIFSSIWGYLVGKAFFSKKRLWQASLAGILIAGLIHGLFNFLTTSSTLRILSALLILVIWLWRIRFLEKGNE